MVYVDAMVSSAEDAQINPYLCTPICTVQCLNLPVHMVCHVQEVVLSDLTNSSIELCI